MTEHERRVETIRSSFWDEEPEEDNPFEARACYCCGFDIYGDLLGKVSWPELVCMLFLHDRPTPGQAALLEGLAVALADPGPRDHSVRAAMCCGASLATNTAALSSALAVGSGSLMGAREISLCLRAWEACGLELESWTERLRHPPEERIDSWRPCPHPPGFAPYGSSCPLPVRQTLSHLAGVGPGKALPWLEQHREQLERAADRPLAMSGVAAAALFDLGLDQDAAELLYLVLRLPGAAAHAVEQRRLGRVQYPFFMDCVEVAEPEPAGERS